MDKFLVLIPENHNTSATVPELAVDSAAAASQSDMLLAAKTSRSDSTTSAASTTSSASTATITSVKDDVKVVPQVLNGGFLKLGNGH